MNRPHPLWNAHEVQQRLLDRGWTLADLEEAVALHAHLRHDEACRQAIADYDTLRAALAPAEGLGDAELPAGGWASLEERLATHLTSQNRSPRLQYRPGPILRVAALVALAAMVGGAGFLMGWLTPEGNSPAVSHPREARSSGASESGIVCLLPPPPIPASTPALPDYLPQNIEQQVGIFNKVADVFDHQAGWVAFTNGQTELGLTPVPLAQPQRLLLLRLSLAHHERLVSRSDVVIVPGQRATLQFPLPDGSTLRYQLHVSRQRPSRVGLLAELESPDGQSEPLAAIATDLNHAAADTGWSGNMTAQSGPYELVLGFQEAPSTSGNGSTAPW